MFNFSPYVTEMLCLFLIIGRLHDTFFSSFILVLTPRIGLLTISKLAFTEYLPVFLVMFYIIWLVMVITMMDHVIYNASYNLFAALLIEIENGGAQKYFSDAVTHSFEFCCIILLYFPNRAWFWSSNMQWNT